MIDIIEKVNKGFLKGKLREIYDRTQGACESPDEYECYTLHEIAKQTKGNILEIGTWRGRSASFLAEAIKDTDRELYLVEWFSGDNTGGEKPDRGIMEEALKEYKYKLFDEDMLKVDYSQMKNIDMVFYDSDHETEPTTQTLSRIHAHLNPNAIVCIHDANWEMTQKAIKNVEHLYRLMYTINVWEGFCILKKI